MTSPRKPTAGFWITVGLVAVLVGYPVSFGPACWLCHKEVIGVRSVWVAYYPVVWTARHGSQPLRSLIYKYEAIFQGRRAASADWAIDVQDQMDKLIRAHSSGGINAGYGNFDDSPGENSPIAHDSVELWLIDP